MANLCLTWGDCAKLGSLNSKTEEEEELLLFLLDVELIGEEHIDDTGDVLCGGGGGCKWHLLAAGDLALYGEKLGCAEKLQLLPGDRNGEMHEFFGEKLFKLRFLTLLGSFGAGTLNFDSDFGNSNGISRGDGGGFKDSLFKLLLFSGVSCPIDVGVGVVAPRFLVAFGEDSIELTPESQGETGTEKLLLLFLGDSAE